MIALASAALVAGAGAVAVAPSASAGAYCSITAASHTSYMAYTDTIMGCVTTRARAGVRAGSAATTWTPWSVKTGDGRAAAYGNDVLNGHHRAYYEQLKYWERYS